MHKFPPSWWGAVEAAGFPMPHVWLQWLLQELCSPGSLETAGVLNIPHPFFCLGFQRANYDYRSCWAAQMLNSWITQGACIAKGFRGRQGRARSNELHGISAGEVSGPEYRQVNVWIALVQDDFILEIKLVFSQQVTGLPLTLSLYQCKSSDLPLIHICKSLLNKEFPWKFPCSCYGIWQAYWSSGIQILQNEKGGERWVWCWYSGFRCLRNS